MSRRWFAPLAALLLLISTPLPAQESPKATAPATFRAGFAERDISPQIGMEWPGGYNKAHHTKFHDACKARAAVFDDGASRVALVGIDAIGIREVTVAKIRQAIEQRCGIPGGSVMIAASHTHSGGPLGWFLPGEVDAADELVKKLVYEQSTIGNAEFIAYVEKQVVDAVCSANAAREPARCAAGFGHEDQVSFNRRLRMKNGQTWSHPRPGNPDVVDFAGPIDPQVGVLGAWDSAGKPIGCIVNFACHCTTGPGGISADYVYYLEKTIRGLLGDDMIVVFMPGPSGEITQVDNRMKYDLKQFGEIGSRFVGGRLGAEALRTLLAIEQSAGTRMPLAAKQEVLDISRRIPKPERVARARELVEQPADKVDSTERTFAKDLVMLDALIKMRANVEVEVQAIQVGPAVYLSCPAEYFVQFGLDIKAGSPFKFTFPVSLANGCCGYVPTEEALGPRGGGYETRLTAYSNLEAAGGRKMADALIKLSKQLTPGPVPLPPPLKPFQNNPWTYGNLGPELD